MEQPTINSINEIIRKAIINLKQIEETKHMLYRDYVYYVDTLDIPHKGRCSTPCCLVNTETHDKYYITVWGSGGVLEKSEVVLIPNALKISKIQDYETVIIYWRIRSGMLRIKPLAVIASIEICGTPTCLAEKMVRLVYDSAINLEEYLRDVLSKISDNTSVDSTEAHLG